ncbi:uncharacterized protein LOC124313031 isoform X2 [Daphnia pulicaria]|uniref:uncharacterized protein LOC124313031 isoform X2 n=1 Tax=Daphnia pulicaria TaxID=35523 RepID=UPI001EEA7E3E|nr:uncharacterized protein LOC124313031 isoform X2 [Daphnia pulicaria]
MMTRYFNVVFCAVIFLAAGSVANGLSLEDRFEQLTNNFNEMKQMLAIKDIRLEALELKVQQHEEKVTRLELALLNEQRINSKLSSTELIEIRRKSIARSAMPRTCREAHLADPTLTSGMHWIDPDGQAVGDDPIYVYCDMNSGSTSVVHDTKMPLDVGHCAEPGCYSKVINYNATIRQMAALAQLSSECHQSIKYDCYYAPFEFDKIAYAWWNDRNGNAKYFWSGGNTDVHTCQCGIDNNCVDATLECNCDATAPAQLADNGIITDKNVLPITRLNFGRTQLASSTGVHTLGRFQCSGQVAVTGMPKSCEDLWKIGHSLSGLYSVMGSKMVESVYCDFTKLPSDAGFQQWIGFDDIISSPTYFYVQRGSQVFNETNTPIPFDVEILNIGGAMDLQSGKFTAPRTGKYFFSLSGLGYFPASSLNLRMYVRLFKNGSIFANAYCGSTSPGNMFETFSLQSTVQLQVGEQIWVEITSISAGAYLDGFGYTHFTGWLLQEDISLSLNVI